MNNIHLIESKKSFDDLCVKLKSEKQIALDTEFERRHTYFAKLSIIQIGLRSGEKYVIDVLKIEDISALKDILLDNNILKIIHSLYQDIEIFYHLFGVVAVNLYDTQTAASAVKLGKSISYSELVKKICNVTLNKDMQKCNWIKRPLSQEQIEYAAADVEYSFKIYDHLAFQIRKLHTEELFKSMMIKHHHKDTYAINYQDIWKKVSFHHKSDRLVNNMQMLSSLREEIAVQENIPRSHALSDSDLVSIAEKLPTTIDLLDKLKIDSKAMRHVKYKNKIITCCAGLK